MPKKDTNTILGFLSNGFVLLLAGSIITYFFVPALQAKFKEKQQKIDDRRECVTQFHLYANSIWQEYYVILPVDFSADLDNGAYETIINEISKIKVKRYDAYAKVQSLALAFRKNIKVKSGAEYLLEDYAIKINTISNQIRQLVKDKRDGYKYVNSERELKTIVSAVQYCVDYENQIAETLIKQASLLE